MRKRLTTAGKTSRASGATKPATSGCSTVAVAASTEAAAVAVAEDCAMQPGEPESAGVSSRAADPAAPRAGTAARAGWGRRSRWGGGKRRAVGPVIGDQLAKLLLELHQPNSESQGMCACGQAAPCDSQSFAKAFVDDTGPLSDRDVAVASRPPNVALDSLRTEAALDLPRPEVLAGVNSPQPAPTAEAVARRGRPMPARHAERRLPGSLELDATMVIERVPADERRPMPVAPAVAAAVRESMLGLNSRDEQDWDVTQEMEKVPGLPDTRLAV
ncbi:MAG: hypothetical protein ACRDT1_09390 [Micromonosporaceae bacterium]